MRKVFWITCAVIALVVSAGAQAQSGQSGTLEWIGPTSYEDGSPLNPVTDLDEYRIYHCADPVVCDLGNARLAQVAPPSNTMAAVPDLPYAENMFFMTAVATNGLESVMSNTEMLFVPDNRRPDAPTIVQITLAELIEACKAGLPSFAGRCAELNAFNE